MNNNIFKDIKVEFFMKFSIPISLYHLHRHILSLFNMWILAYLKKIQFNEKKTTEFLNSVVYEYFINYALTVSFSLTFLITHIINTLIS